MRNQICLVFTIIILIIRSSHQLQKRDFKIDIKRVTTRYEEDSTCKIDLFLTKFNRTHTALNANISLVDTMDNKYRFELELRVWSDGGWKRNYVTYGNKDPCVQLKYTLGKTWIDIAKAAKANWKCPYYPGFYRIIDYYINVGSVPIVFGSGIFKLFLRVFKEKKFIVELDIDAEINDVI